MRAASAAQIPPRHIDSPLARYYAPSELLASAGPYDDLAIRVRQSIRRLGEVVLAPVLLDTSGLLTASSPARALAAGAVAVLDQSDSPRLCRPGGVERVPAVLETG